MNPTVFKVGKIVVKVLTIAVPAVSSYFASKELDEKITKKVAEAIANQNK